MQRLYNYFSAKKYYINMIEVMECYRFDVGPSLRVERASDVERLLYLITKSVMGVMLGVGDMGCEAGAGGRGGPRDVIVLI